MITAISLATGYGPKKVIGGISFSLASGLVHGLIGPYGAG